ncbi:putative pyridine nucleotide-disulfide oxidoreductase RclA [Exophiala dermatitidis]
MSKHYDAIVIGSGQGGGPLAQALAKAGRRTALIEAHHVGGTCINEGCTPTKTMVASAKVAARARRAGDYGVRIQNNGSVTLNMQKVRRRKRDLVDSFRRGSEARITATEGLDLIWGTARFVGAKEVEVVMNATTTPQRSTDTNDATQKTTSSDNNAFLPTETLSLTGDQIFINAGCSPAPLVVTKPDSDDTIAQQDGSVGNNILNSTSIMELAEVPHHLVVLGGGAVGCEFAQMMRRFGARVSLVQRAQQLLPNEDPDVAAQMLKIFVDDGIEVYLGAQTRHVSHISSDQIVVEVEIQQQQNNKDDAGQVKKADADEDKTEGNHGQNGGPISKSLLASHVLVATGRLPNTASLNLAAAGIDVDARGFIKVDEHLRTTAPDVYALGDIKGGPAQTHVSYDDYRVLRDNLITGTVADDDGTTTSRTAANRLIPYTIFTDPQLGRVGLTEKAARARAQSSGQKIKVAKMPMAYVARALEMDETQGLMKAVVDVESRHILGFACLGVEGGEIMSMVQLAMMGGLTYDKLENAIFAHPCLSESLNNLWGFLE